ncbi:MAG: acetolactate synthase small subunit [Candidatus Bathyarchaeia archaeon]
MGEERTHVIAAIVEHKPGVLYRVSNMFRRRSFNIESISVGPIEPRDLARMTIAVNGDEKMVEQVIKHMAKLIDVIKVTRLDPTNTVTREMALVKVHCANTRTRSDIINYANIFRARVVDVSLESLMMEITGDSEKIDAFIDLMKPFGVKEIARTGITALSRGVRSVRIE